MPHPVKPAIFKLFDGTHQSHQNLLEQLEGEIKLGNETLDLDKKVQSNRRAKKIYDWLNSLYAGSGIIMSSDSKTINRYCLLSASLDAQWELKAEIEKRIRAQCKAEGKKCTEFTLFKSFAAAGIDFYKFENEIDKKSALLLGLENVLFLTPMSKIKARSGTVTKVDKEGTALDKAGFGTI